MNKKNETNAPARMIHVRLAENTHRLLRVKVAELDTTIQEWVAELIQKETKASKKGR